MSAYQSILGRVWIVSGRKPEDLSIGSPVWVCKSVLHTWIDLDLNWVAFPTRRSRDLFAGPRQRAPIISPHQDQERKRRLLVQPERGTG